MAAARNDSGEGAGARPSSWRWLSAWAPVAAIGLAGALYTLLAGDPFESLESKAHDGLLRLRARAGLAPNADAHVVHLDLAPADPGAAGDVAKEYKDAADVIDEASELGASAIVFDVVFGRGDHEAAQPIMDAIERARGRNCAVVLSEFVRENGERARSFPFRERMQPAGLINVKSDSDGVYRRYAPAQRTSEGVEPSLALAGYLAWQKLDWKKDVKVSDSGAMWEELNADAALERRRADTAEMLLNFRVPWEMRGPAAARSYTRDQLQSIYDAKQELPNPNASDFADRVILVSYADPGISDTGATPLGLHQPRALLHLVALNDLIQRSALRSLSRRGEAALLACLMVFGCAARFCRRTALLVALWLAVATGLFGVSFFMLVHANTLLDGVALVTVWSAMIGAEFIRRSLLPRGPIQTITPLPPTAQKSALDPAVSNTLAKRVFISSRSADYPHARRVHEFLRSRGVPSFFSEETLLERASSDYRQEIDRALDEAEHMVVIASSATNVKSAWVEAEWGFFINEKRAGRKNGNLVTLTVGSLKPGDLPPSLRYYEVIEIGAEGMERLLRYLGL